MLIRSHLNLHQRAHIRSFCALLIEMQLTYMPLKTASLTISVFFSGFCRLFSRMCCHNLLTTWDGGWGSDVRWMVECIKQMPCDSNPRECLRKWPLRLGLTLFVWASGLQVRLPACASWLRHLKTWKALQNKHFLIFQLGGCPLPWWQIAVLREPISN